MSSTIFITFVSVCFQIFGTLADQSMSSFPPVPTTPEGSGLAPPGRQLIVDGVAFQEPVNITAVHLGGRCNPITGTCYGVFQVWRQVVAGPLGSATAFSEVHACTLSVDVADLSYFSTSISLPAPAKSVEAGDILGFSAPNNDVNSPGMNVATTPAAASLGATLYEFSQGAIILTIGQAGLPGTPSNVNLAISPEVSRSTSPASTTVNDVVTTTTPPTPNNNSNNNDSTGNKMAAPDDSTGLIIGVVAAVVVVLVLLMLIVVAAVVMVLRGKRKKASCSVMAALSEIQPEKTAQPSSGPGSLLEPQYTALKTPDVPQVYAKLSKATESREHICCTSNSSSNYDCVEEYVLPMMDKNRSNLATITRSKKAENSSTRGASSRYYANVQSTPTDHEPGTDQTNMYYCDANKLNMSKPTDVFYEKVGIPNQDMESDYI